MTDKHARAKARHAQKRNEHRREQDRARRENPPRARMFRRARINPISPAVYGDAALKELGLE